MKSNNGQTQTQFKVFQFVNRGGSKSWRVTGMAREGKRVRLNFANLDAARAKQLELESKYLERSSPETLQATTLSAQQLRLAEAVFLRLPQNEDLIPAVEKWLSGSQERTIIQGKRLDEAVEGFSIWLETAALREKTRVNLKSRTNIFRSLVGDVQLSAITPELIDSFLAKRKISAVTADNDRRALSRFFRFCCERPRRWMLHNPCRDVCVQKPERVEPRILSVTQAHELLKSAQEFRKGQLLGYVALGLFGGLRPFEAARLNWERINFADREIRIDGAISKVKRPRVVPINVTLHSWLLKCDKKPFAHGDWDNGLREVRRRANITKWPADVIRHTALSHYFRKTKSFGDTAEWGGTSEAVIREHYMSRVTSSECKQYWGLRP